MRHYLLVAQDRPHVEHHRRDGEGWVVDVIEGLEGAVEIAAIDVTIPLRDVYERVAEGW